MPRPVPAPMRRITSRQFHTRPSHWRAQFLLECGHDLRVVGSLSERVRLKNTLRQKSARCRKCEMEGKQITKVFTA